MSIITLLTDFGEEDEFVGVMKGVILGVNPSATIIDISHRVDPQDIVEAAYRIPSYYKFFPRGSVHIIVVDPGVGSNRAIIALEMAGHVFLAPDNGVLSLLLDCGDIDSIVRVNNKDFFLTPVSQTFHGRDIFAPVGAHISLGIAVGKTGTPVDKGDLFDLDLQKPRLTDDGKLFGTIISIDRFGNLITNIELTHVNESFGSPPHDIRPRQAGGFLRFRRGYSPSTAPRRIQSRRSKGFGPWISTRAVSHPGFEPRDFHYAIADAHRLVFHKDMIAANRRAAAKL